MSLDSGEANIFENMLSVKQESADQPLRKCVSQALDKYFAQLDGHEAHDLYHLVLEEVERPMLASVLNHTNGNQSRAAKVLGISRSTLRKKLALYGME